MPEPVRIGLAGAGLVGLRHVAAMIGVPGVHLAAVCDPGCPDATDLPMVPGFAALLDVADGVILAVPNDLHAPLAVEALKAGVPVLVEKPLAGTAAEGARIVATAAATGVPLLVGHHRRHNPVIAQAKRTIESGVLGRLTAVHGQCWLPKPAAYFGATWRQTKGAGPLFINLIHDVDLLMHLCGPITLVQALQSNAVRGAAVEDTMAVTLRFASGALGTVSLSDAALGPWSWELTAHENPAYPGTDQTCYWIGGTAGSLALPHLTHWHQMDGPDWWAPISATRTPVAHADPLVAQIAHFAAVIRGEAAPLVSGADGLRALQVVEAIKKAAETGTAVTLPDPV